MKIQKEVNRYIIYYYYRDSKTGDSINHGLYRSQWWGIGYNYHNEQKGFWLEKKSVL